MFILRETCQRLVFTGSSCISLIPSWLPKATATLLLNMRGSHMVSGVVVCCDLVIPLEWAKVRSDRLALGDLTYVKFYPHTSCGR